MRGSTAGLVFLAVGRRTFASLSERLYSVLLSLVMLVMAVWMVWRRLAVPGL